MGLEKALGVLGNVWEKSLAQQMERLGGTLGFKVKSGIPEALLNLPREKLMTLIGEMAKNWIAGDGFWFLAVEAGYGMSDAKRCNDSCWTRYSPFEAWSVKRFLNLPRDAGLEGLKRALQFRFYAWINEQSLIDEGPGNIVLQMNACRVQMARNRKGLPDYPCKSGGLVEYRTFAETIDSRIQTTCIGCPPDDHPEAWYCAWRFTMPTVP
jgi:hypothetical protein